MPPALTTFLSQVAADIDAAFLAYLPQISAPYAPVIEAMHYSFLGKGKRVRPALVCAWACAQQDEDAAYALAVQVGLAFECLHTYSLIHDDLPCMDDDDLRRGQPSCHKKFDECTAVLAGDGLQALAFDILSKLHFDSETWIELVGLLASAAGVSGMVGGQMWDMLMEGAGKKALSVAGLTQLQSMKTGALLTASCMAGAMAVRADSHLAKDYGMALGALFQITDDLLDTQTGTGKTAGKDITADKATFVTLLGADAATVRADALLTKCLEVLAPLGDKGALLADMAQFVRTRTY